MADLTAFGLEPRDPPVDDGRDESGDDLDALWTECIDCGYVGYEVKSCREDGVPLCPECFAVREGLR